MNKLFVKQIILYQIQIENRMCKNILISEISIKFNFD